MTSFTTTLLPIFSRFLSELYESTGETPIGMALPAELFDRLVTELGPRLLYDCTDEELRAGQSVVRLVLPAGQLLIRRVKVETMRLRL